MAFNTTIDLNVTNKECLARVSDFGGTTIMDICRGTEVYIPWGSLTWFGTISFSIGGILVFGVLLALFGSIVVTIWKGRYSW